MRHVWHTGYLELKVLNMINHSAGSPKSLALLARIFSHKNLKFVTKWKFSAYTKGLANDFFDFAICFKTEPVLNLKKESQMDNSVFVFAETVLKTCVAFEMQVLKRFETFLKACRIILSHYLNKSYLLLCFQCFLTLLFNVSTP